MNRRSLLKVLGLLPFVPLSLKAKIIEPKRNESGYKYLIKPKLREDGRSLYFQLFKIQTKKFDDFMNRDLNKHIYSETTAEVFYTWNLKMERFFILALYDEKQNITGYSPFKLV